MSNIYCYIHFTRAFYPFIIHPSAYPIVHPFIHSFILPEKLSVGWYSVISQWTCFTNLAPVGNTSNWCPTTHVNWPRNKFAVPVLGSKNYPRLLSRGHAGLSITKHAESWRMPSQELPSNCRECYVESCWDSVFFPLQRLLWKKTHAEIRFLVPD